MNTPGTPGRDRDAVVLPAERRFYRRETLRKAHLSPDPITIHYEDGAWWWGKSYSAQGAMYTHRGAGSKVPTTGWTVVNGGKAPAPTLLVHVSLPPPALTVLFQDLHGCYGCSHMHHRSGCETNTGHLRITPPPTHTHTVLAVQSTQSCLFHYALRKPPHDE